MDPDARRAAITRAARAVFARLGYHKAGIADIVNEVGVARGTFYRYFESKRDVFQQILHAMMAEVVAVVVPIDVTRDIPPQVFANLDRLVRAVTAEDVCQVLFSEALGIDDEADDALRDFYGEALGRIEAALRTGQAMGIVHAGDVRLKARCLLGLIKEPVVQSSIDGTPLDTEQLVTEIHQLLQDGLLRSQRAEG